MKPVRATFIGIQEGFGRIGPTHLYTVHEQVGHHPAGSTLSLRTIVSFGFIPATYSTP